MIYDAKLILSRGGEGKTKGSSGEKWLGETMRRRPPYTQAMTSVFQHGFLVPGASCVLQILGQGGILGRECLGLLRHTDPCPLRCFRSIKVEYQGYPDGWRSLGTSCLTHPHLCRCPQLLLQGLLGAISCHGGGCSLGHCPSRARAHSWLESPRCF